MTPLGQIAQLWRYPVKSMQGERCERFGVGAYGIDGDRRFAFESAEAPVGKPLLRSMERSAMLRSQASHTAGGRVVVRVPSGARLGPEAADLPPQLGLEADMSDGLRMLDCDRPFTDVRPIALHSLATEHRLAAQLGGFDARRLRSNIVLALSRAEPFAEDEFAGRVIQLGAEVQLQMLERIPRCRMVSLHPETAVEDRTSLRWLAQQRDGRAGIYARTLIPGSIASGDPVYLVT